MLHFCFLCFINIMKFFSFFWFSTPTHPFPVPSHSLPHFSFFKTRTLKFGFLVTGSQRLSSAHLLWLKPLMKNNWCNHCVPYHQYTCWTARSLHPSFACWPHLGCGSGEHFPHASSSQVKWKHTQSQIPVQYQVFGKQGFSQRQSIYVSKESPTSLWTMKPETRRWKLWVCDIEAQSAFGEPNKVWRCL